jgi:hypothetical protein
MKGPGVDFLSSDGKPLPDVSAKYFKAAGYASGKYEGKEKILMVGSNAGVAAKTAEVAKEQLEKMGFNIQMRLVQQQTMYTRYCNTPSAKVAICPNVGWLKDFADGQTMLDPTFNGKNILEQGNSNWAQLNDPAINKAMDDAELLPKEEREAALDRLQLADAVAHVHGQAHRAALLGHRAADRLADPEGRVGREAEAAAVVELLDRADQPDRALLDQVQQGHAGVLALEALGEMDDEAQVRLDHAVLGVEIAPLDAASEFELLGGGQEPRAGDALEEDSEAVAELASVLGNRRRSGGHARQHRPRCSRDSVVKIRAC